MTIRRGGQNMFITQRRLCTVLLFCFTALNAPGVNAGETSSRRRAADSSAASAPTDQQVAECPPDLSS